MSFINKTLRGGIFFLFPLMLIYIVIHKVFDILYPLAVRLSTPIQVSSDTQIDPSYFLAILVIILLSFVFGLLASSSFGVLSLKWLENNILDMFPAYKLMKSTSQSVLGVDDGYSLPVVLVPIDGWMLAFLVDVLSNDEVLTFVPGAPNRWEGNLVIFNKNEIRKTKLSQKEALSILKDTGIGTSELLEKRSVASQNKKTYNSHSK